MREAITKEYLNDKDVSGQNLFLKVDIPIWEEFTIGLIEQGGWATNNKFRGVRGMICRVPETNIFKDIYIVTDNEKEKKFFEFIRSGFTERNKERYNDVKIEQYRRGNKNVYVIEYKYK